MNPLTIFITGAGSGFGFLLSTALCRAHTVIAVVRQEKDCKKLIEAGVQFVYQADISAAEERTYLFKELDRHITSIDVLINNAGYCQGGVTEALEEKDWEAQLQTNIIGTAQLTKGILPFLRESPRAKIIQMGSISGSTGLPGMGAYAASKFALRGWSESLRYELLPQGISVTLLEIASFKTNIWKKSTASAKYSGMPYYSELENSLKNHAEKNAASSKDPAEILHCVQKIISSRNPPFTLRVGKGLKRWKTLKLLFPQSWIDAIVMRNTK